MSWTILPVKILFEPRILLKGERALAGLRVFVRNADGAGSEPSTCANQVSRTQPL